MAERIGPVGAAPAPPDRVPNFEHPDEDGRTNILLGIAVMAGLTTVSFGLRSFAKTKWLYIGSIIYCPAAYFTKVTLLLLEARVFSVYEKVAKGIHVFIIVLLVLYAPIMFTKAFFCSPIAAAWDSDVQPSKCLNQRKVFIADMCLGLVVDLVILILPLLLVRSLQMPLRTKVKVVTLLGAGGAATGVSTFRLYKAILFVEPSDATAGFVLLDLTT
ncbi:hypothetical protein CCHL11_06424 [Colletotrichum chlorophyti]|uniref:Rhodopsin domain-containing protein n=1 Tax=Colletotrichum chlorophyti TaxID=708187 RepID=A0A1Q8RPV1_9PEZI|nr:hypothetical protein CCHL11_06424 [Colletotrichum chlorophyti]